MHPSTYLWRYLILPVIFRWIGGAANSGQQSLRFLLPGGEPYAIDLEAIHCVKQSGYKLSQPKELQQDNGVLFHCSVVCGVFDASQMIAIEANGTSKLSWEVLVRETSLASRPASQVLRLLLSKHSPADAVAELLKRTAQYLNPNKGVGVGVGSCDFDDDLPEVSSGE